MSWHRLLHLFIACWCIDYGFTAWRTVAVEKHGRFSFRPPVFKQIRHPMQQCCRCGTTRVIYDHSYQIRRVFDEGTPAEHPGVTITEIDASREAIRS